MTKKITALIIILVMLFSLSACKESKNTDTPDTSVNTTEPTITTTVFGTFTAQTLDGSQVTDKIFSENKVTMVNIWATFCGPCIKEMPDLARLAKDYKDKGVAIIGIPCDVTDSLGNVNEQLLETANKIVAQTGADYMHIIPTKELNDAKLSTVYSVPETVFVNSKGEIIKESYIGSRSYEQWAEIIDSMLSEVNG